jgi:hypothetical protein
MARIIQSVKKMNNNDGNEIEEYTVIYTDSVISNVPKVIANMDYVDVLSWIDDGNTVDEAD